MGLLLKGLSPFIYICFFRGILHATQLWVRCIASKNGQSVPLIYNRYINMYYENILYKRFRDNFSPHLSSEFSQTHLTHFTPMFHFYTPWKCQKTRGFLTFSGGMEMISALNGLRRKFCVLLGQSSQNQFVRKCFLSQNQFGASKGFICKNKNLS